jgi:hypothetical protein
VGEAHEKEWNINVRGTVGEFKVTLWAKALEQHLDAIEGISGLTADLVASGREQTPGATDERDRESEEKRGKTERLIGRDGFGKTLAAKQREDNAAQREEKEGCVIVIANEVGERN